MAEDVRVATAPTVGDNGAAAPSEVVEAQVEAALPPGEEEAPPPKPWEEITFEEALGRRADWKQSHDEEKETHAAEKRLEWFQSVQPQLEGIQAEHKTRAAALEKAAPALISAAEAWNALVASLNESRRDGTLTAADYQELFRNPEMVKYVKLLAENSKLIGDENVRAGVEAKLEEFDNSRKAETFSQGVSWLLGQIFVGSRRPALAKMAEAYGKAKDWDERAKVVTQALDGWADGHADKRATEVKGALTEEQKAKERKGQGSDATRGGASASKSYTQMTPEERARLTPREIDAMTARFIKQHA